jgi:hypothetical protein
VKLAGRDRVGCRHECCQRLDDPSKNQKHRSQRYQTDYKERADNQLLHKLDFRFDRVQRDRKTNGANGSDMITDGQTGVDSLFELCHDR